MQRRLIRSAYAGSVAVALTALMACTATTSGNATATDPASDPTSRTTSTTAVPHSSGAPSSALPSTSASGATPSGVTPDTRRTAQQVLARMSLAQRVGQLLMVGCDTTDATPDTIAAIRKYAVGSVILDGNTSQGLAATQAVTRALQSAAPSTAKLFISTDQEGGEVQRLQGSGFSTIPSGLEQGQISPARLRSDATTWGRQLKRAGVNVDLGPVMDTVPAGFGNNPPIGNLDREFGHTPGVVASHGVAVVRGLDAAGVDATVKHFPGLGRVRENTDTRSGVTDTVTTKHDPYLQPYQAAVTAGTPFVMMSTAIYRKIDPGTPAAFSSTIVTGMLRDQLGFRGVIISDDLGGAAQVRAYGVGQRAVDFVAAGGDLVLTIDATQAQAMTAALISRARTDPAFRNQVNAAALTVLSAKQASGLLR